MTFSLLMVVWVGAVALVGMLMMTMTPVTMMVKMTCRLPDTWWPKTVQSYSTPNSTVMFTLFYTRPITPFSLILHFTTVPDTQALLDVHFTSPFRGNYSACGSC